MESWESPSPGGLDDSSTRSRSEQGAEGDPDMSCLKGLDRLLKYLSFVLTVILTGAEVLKATPDESTAERITPVTTAREAYQQGMVLERAQDWQAAVEHYQNSLKTWPDDQTLQYALRRSRIQAAIDRRYADLSFMRDLRSQSPQKLLILLEDVLSRIRSQYVEDISSTAFMAHGTESLYWALVNRRFIEGNGLQQLTDKVRAWRLQLRDTYWNHPVSGWESGRRLVLEIADKAHRELQLDASAVILEYIFGGSNSLDDYSGLLTPQRLQDLYSNIDGEFVGIGVEMRAVTGQGLELVNVLPHSPAAECGVKPGDRIVRIDDVDCRQMHLDEAASRLQGSPGSSVVLELEDPQTGDRRVARLTRRQVKIQSIPVAEIIDAVEGIAYIKMTAFQRDTPRELDAALFMLHREGMRALVWDLRGNPGGLLPSAVEILDRFLAEGTLVSTKGRTEDQNWNYTAHRPGTWNMPLVVLIDQDSASASEIVAGAIRDHQRGTLVGRKTYGKWSVQSILPLPMATGLRLTTALFYSPSGQTYNKLGIRPDVEVPVLSQGSSVRGHGKKLLEQDADVEMALTILRRQFAKR